jgi:hypothetical protein
VCVCVRARVVCVRDGGVGSRVWSGGRRASLPGCRCRVGRLGETARGQVLGLVSKSLTQSKSPWERCRVGRLGRAHEGDLVERIVQGRGVQGRCRVGWVGEVLVGWAGPVGR